MEICKHFSLKTLLFGLAITVLSFPTPLRAKSMLIPEDQGLFELIIAPGEQTLEIDDGDDVYTVYSRTLSQDELNALTAGVEYWVSVLGDGALNSDPLPILVYGDDIANASASSNLSDVGLTLLGTGLLGLDVSSEQYLAIVEIGSGLDYDLADYITALSHSRQSVALSSVMVHEVMHALGITSFTQADDYEAPTEFWFNENISTFNSLLYDSFGQQTEPGIRIKVVTRTEIDSGSFNRDSNTFYLIASGETSPDASYSGARLSGKNISEVLNGAWLSFPEDYTSKILGNTYDDLVPGIPVNGVEDGWVELSHFELQNSLMSHQSWRNWGIPMEVELAALQDIGYDIDRREYFGYSVYNSGTKDNPYVFESTNPYYDRKDGDWLVDTPNDTAHGIGLHVYGSYVNVTQAADLLSIGTDAVGIRLEGVGNILTIAEGVRVRSDGAYGTGLLVSYGKEHVVNLEGTVTALGGHCSTL